MVNTVDAQISAAHTQARIFRAGRSFASLLWLNASAMQAELWQWMDGHTLTEASALQISCMMLIAMLLRPTASTVGRISRPLGSSMYRIRQKVMPENMVRQSLS